MFNLLNGNEPLSKLFIELVPESFVLRMLPSLEQNLVVKFDSLVKDKTDPQVYESYHDIAMKHMR